jgi:HipA N-terminal domain
MTAVKPFRSYVVVTDSPGGANINLPSTSVIGVQCEGTGGASFVTPGAYVHLEAKPRTLGMADFEVHIDLDNNTRPIGVARCNRVRGTEVILFEYDRSWLSDPERFALEPALTLSRGTFAPPAGLATFGSIGDSAPDTWGRRLMQRAERRLAERESRTVRTFTESGFDDSLGRISVPCGC